MPLIDADRKLLERCLQKEPQAWTEFVERFMGLIYHVIHHVSHHRSVPMTPEDVEDHCAEIFLVFLENDFAVLRQFQGKSSLATYLTVVARRICVKEVVKRQRAAELGHVSLHRASLQDATSTSTPTSQEFETPIAPEELDQVLQDLPERDAEIVRMHHIQGLSYRQISQNLGIEENTVGPTLSRARKKLRHLVEQRASS